MTATRLSQQQQHQDEQQPQDEESVLMSNPPDKWSDAMKMLSKEIDDIKTNKGAKWKGRLAARTQLLDVMLNEGCEGYDRFKIERNYL